MNYTCANPDCRMSLLDLRATNLVLETPKVGDLLVCGGCSQANEVTLLGTEIVSAEKFNSLTDDEKADLSFAVRAIARKLRSN